MDGHTNKLKERERERERGRDKSEDGGKANGKRKRERQQRETRKQLLGFLSVKHKKAVVQLKHIHETDQ